MLQRRILNLAARECLPDAPDYSTRLEEDEIMELFEHEEIDWSKAERVKLPNLKPTDRCQVC